MVVDNSAATTSKNPNDYASENTNDKVTMLSYQEMNNTSYFANNNARKAQPTDYAVDNGVGKIDNGCYYWTRSPYNDKSVSIVTNSGSLSSYTVDYDWFGVRPVIQINYVVL